MSLGYLQSIETNRRGSLGFTLLDAKSILTNAAGVISPTPAPTQSSGTNYTPWVIGGVVLVGLALVLKGSKK